MQVIKKVFEDQNLEFTEFKDFIVSVQGFTEKFNDEFNNVKDVKVSIDASISVHLNVFFLEEQKEYLKSLKDFLDGFDEDMKVTELREHLQSALDHIKETA